jgi:hypothetical protein
VNPDVERPASGHATRVRTIAWSVSLAAVAAFCALVLMGNTTGRAGSMTAGVWVGVLAAGGIVLAAGAVLVMETVWRFIGRHERSDRRGPDAPSGPAA